MALANPYKSHYTRISVIARAKGKSIPVHPISDLVMPAVYPIATLTNLRSLPGAYSCQGSRDSGLVNFGFLVCGLVPQVIFTIALADLSINGRAFTLLRPFPM